MVLLLGFLSQGLFGLRLLVQLWHTEKYKSTVAPSLYWFISLWAALLYLSYGVIEKDIVIVVGQLITYFIYIRNVQLQGKWESCPLFWRVFYLLMPIALLIGFALTISTIRLEELNNPLLLVGFLGQFLMNIRFIIQWMYAEKMSSASFPLIFWYTSIFGSIMLLAYGWWHPQRGIDPVIILSQVLALLVYTRSMFLQLRVEALKLVEK